MPTLPERAINSAKPNINHTFYHHETSSIIRCVSREGVLCLEFGRTCNNWDVEDRGEI